MVFQGTIMICPKCGSNNIQAVTVQKTKSDTTSKTKGFGCIKASCGFLLFHWWGLLCGLCGMGKGKDKTVTTTDTEIKYCCLDCGNQFKK